MQQAAALDRAEHGLDSGSGPAYLGIVARAFIAIAVVLSCVVWWSHTQLQPEEEALHPKDRPHLSVGDSVLGGWLWYDGWWYHHIAGHGYGGDQADRFRASQQSAAPFFPAYPIVVATVAVATRDVALAQILTTFALGLSAALLFARWCRGRMGRRATLVACGLLLVYPYAWFLYGSGYADALLLTATIAAFLLLEADRPLLAGLVGIVATASRPTGILVVIGLVAVALERRGTITHDPTAHLLRGWHLHRERAQRRDALVLVAVAGMAAYALVAWHVFHDPLAFVHAERAWGQTQGWATWLKLEVVSDFTRHGIQWWARIAAQITLAVVFVLASHRVARRFGWGYGVFSLVMALVPAWSTADFMGTGRYVLTCFPVFAAGGAWLADRTRHPYVMLAPSALILVWLTSLFARGYYLT
ncbi:MAG: hypothetical protein ABIV94_12175 [Acidimicrobiales bacterium]